MTKDEHSNTTYDTMMLKEHFTTDVDLAYNFSLKRVGLKDATFGLTLYNLFGAQYDTNGWIAAQYRNDHGRIIAVNTWAPRDQEAAGFSPAAPFHFMVRLSLNF